MMTNAEKELMNTDPENLFRADVTELGRLIPGMRAAFTNGENVMEYARQRKDALGNSPIATLIAYDLQAESYISGAGEATTLAGVLNRLSSSPRHALGFDIGWSRCAHGLSWLAENAVSVDLFVEDLFEISLAD